MFAPRISPVRSLRLISRRHSSQLSAPYPSAKVRAFPFKVTPEDALLHLAPWASSACLFKQFIGSLGARLLPGFGFKPLLPVQLTPVYFPGWIIDAEAEVDVSSGDQQHKTTGIIHDSYLPGCNFRNLSLVSFSPRTLGYNPDLVPFTEDLKVQHGEQVSCLPYNVSPFSAIDIARSYIDKEVAIDDNLPLSFSTVKPNLFAAYPVLFPLYLARYEYAFPGGDKPRSVTLFMEAWTRKGYIMSEAASADAGANLRDMLPGAPQAFQSFTRLLDSVNTVFLRGLPRSFLQIAAPPDSRTLAALIGKWLDDILEQPQAAKMLATQSGTVVDMDGDPRIREYSGDERIANHRWMAMSKEIASLKMIRDGMQKVGETDRVVTFGMGDKSSDDVLGEAVKTLQEKIETLETRRGDTIPAWWKEWEDASQRSI